VTRELAWLAAAVDSLEIQKEKLMTAKQGKQRLAIDSKQAARLSALLGALQLLKEVDPTRFRDEWKQVVEDLPPSVYGVFFRFGFETESDDDSRQGSSNGEEEQDDNQLDENADGSVSGGSDNGSNPDDTDAEEFYQQLQKGKGAMTWRANATTVDLTTSDIDSLKWTKRCEVVFGL
jgi:hypothetical protein